MFGKRLIAKALTVGFLVAATTWIPDPVLASTDAKISKAMSDLKAATEEFGSPKLEGTDPVNGVDAAALFFGETKINNDFTIVDEVVKADGGTATLFAKTGDDFVRVSTNVPKGAGRATGIVGYKK